MIRRTDNCVESVASLELILAVTIETLNYLADAKDLESNFYTCVGICTQPVRLNDSKQNVLCLDECLFRLFMTSSPWDAWAKYSGNPLFPVPSQDYICAEQAYVATRNKWVGEYGKNRKELCAWLAAQLEEMYGL